MNYHTEGGTLEDLEQMLKGHKRPFILLEGTRKVPKNHELLLTRLGACLAKRFPQAHFRSGNAPGSDSLFASGVSSVDPTRMQVVTPTPGHRKANLHPAYEVVPLQAVSRTFEKDLEEASYLATPSYKSLIEKRKQVPKLGAKANYLLRDTRKVLGDVRSGLAPATVGLFYPKEDPMDGGTGHTIRVCLKQKVPVFLFHQWKEWDVLPD